MPRLCHDGKHGTRRVDKRRFHADTAADHANVCTVLEVCEFLRRNPAVESVYYPAVTDKEMYDRFRRTEGGYGGLLSFVLKNASSTTEPFYDALEITKGPNLGTSFSLCCPFVLIAHYTELDWAETAGASRHLIRISIGLEPAEVLIARIQAAIDLATG